MACKNGHLEVVKILVSLGADVKNRIGIQCASGNNHTEVVRYLLSLGADGADGADFEVLTDHHKKYFAFCEKMKAKIRHRAAKKIYYWIIPKLYAPESISAYNLGMKGYKECFGD